MKMERLIGIVTILQQRGKVTAPWLAEKFEVSKRTINRDIEELCQAGIPIVTTRGPEGGISIMEGFKLDTSVFTAEELEAIFVGLNSVDSVSKTPRAKYLTEKIGMIPVAENMLIDLSSFYKDSLADKIELLKAAIRQRNCVSFHYYYGKGEEDKLIEPALIVFKWSDWYVFGYSRERQDFRMYKLKRLWNLEITEESFEKREIPKEKMEFGSHMTDDIMVTAIYDESVKYRLVEEYGPDWFCTCADGKLLAKRGFTTYEDAVNWFLSLGSKAEVIAPADFRQRMKEEIEKIYNRYI